MTTKQIILLALITGILALGVLGALYPDTVPSVQPAYGDTTKLWEDGSYGLTIGDYQVVGCLPVSPWNGVWSVSPCID